MSATTQVRNALEQLLGSWHQVWSPYATFRTYRSCDWTWWVVLGTAGEDAAKIRVTRTTESGRLVDRFDSSIGWVAVEPSNVLEVLAASGAPDVEAAS